MEETLTSALHESFHNLFHHKSVCRSQSHKHGRFGRHCWLEDHHQVFYSILHHSRMVVPLGTLPRVWVKLFQALPTAQEQIIQSNDHVRRKKIKLKKQTKLDCMDLLNSFTNHSPLPCSAFSVISCNMATC